MPKTKTKTKTKSLTHLRWFFSFKESGVKKSVDRHLGDRAAGTHDDSHLIKEKSMYKLTDQEGQRLTAIMTNTRPDWIPNKPGTVLREANEGEGFPGKDFGHCIRALAHYATQTDPKGGWAKRTPNFYPQDGKHWAATAPDDWQAPRDRTFCEDHRTFDASTCTACWGDIKAGLRPENLLGKHHTPESEDTP